MKIEDVLATLVDDVQEDLSKFWWILYRT
jgi:hypothetical protein